MNQKKITALRRDYKRLRRLYFAYLLAAVLALILYFIDKRGTLVLLGCSLLYHLAVVRPRSGAYQRSYVHTCAQLSLERYLDNAIHTADGVLTPDELRAVRLIADNHARGSILCREGGAGTSKGRAVKLGDTTITHSFPLEGKTHHEFVTGMWITVVLDRDTGLDWRLIGKRAMMPPSRDKFFSAQSDLRTLRETGRDWMEDYLVIFRQDTPAMPDDAFLAAVQKLAALTTGPLALCVQGNKLHVFLINRILGQKVSIREEPADARVETDLLPELGSVLKLADRL